MTRHLLLAATLILAVVAPTVVSVGVADAQPENEKKEALNAYGEGTKQYTLGNWDRAIRHFKSAYELYPDAAFLFNIAQSYRQKGDCKQGSFFYKRYLSAEPSAPNKSEVQGFIRDLDDACRKQQDISEKQPTAAMKPDAPPTTTTTVPVPTPATKPPPANTNVTATTATDTSSTDTSTADTSTTDTSTADTSTTDTSPVEVAEVSNDSGTSDMAIGGSDLAVESAGPSLVVAKAALGSSFVSMGDLETSPLLSLALGAGYPIDLGVVTVDVGAAISYTSVDWSGDTTDGTASLTSLLLNAGVTYPVIDKLNVRGEFGMGTLVFGGLDVPDNIFVPKDSMATGAVGSFNVRAVIGAQYALGDNLAVNVDPIVFNYAAAPSGMRSDIDSITAFQMFVGVGYKL